MGTQESLSEGEASRHSIPTMRILTLVFCLLAISLCLPNSSEGASQRQLSRDVYAAIEHVFPKRAWKPAKCIVQKEVGCPRGKRSCWRSLYSLKVGSVGEIGPWQANPGWFRTGWNGEAPLYPWAWKLKAHALHATLFARELWISAGRRFSRHWYLSSKACRLP